MVRQVVRIGITALICAVLAGCGFNPLNAVGVGRKNPHLEVAAANPYLWNAAQEVLYFLPVQTADPYAGVLITGYGTPPGGGRSYRATIHIDGPQLEASVMRLALMTRSGPAPEATRRAVEDAIFGRARQLRSADLNRNR